MELTFVVGVGGDDRDVTLRVEDDATAADLLAALEHKGPLYVERTGQAIRGRDRLADLDLRPGDRLIGAPAPPSSAAQRLVVSSGFGAGEAYPVEGATVVGREGDVRIADRLLSRRHFEVAPDTVNDMGSANGTFLDGVQVTKPTPLTESAFVEAGRTVFRLAPPAPPAHRGGFGPVEPARPPRVRRKAPGVVASLELPAAARPRRARLPVVTTLLPLVGAVALSFFYGPAMLGFALLAPVLALGSYYEDRRRERGETRDDAAEAAARIDAARRALDGAVADELRRRRDDSPDLVALTDRATSGVGLWDRTAVDDDFLTVRLGVGDVVARSTVETGRNDEGAAAALGLPRRLPSAPVTVRLDRVLGIAGADAVAAAAVLDLCVRQAPGDVVVLIALDQRRERDWSWARWLPHARADLLDGDVATVAFGDEASALLAAVALLATSRAGQPDAAGRDRPAVVVVTSPGVPGGRAALREIAAARDVGVALLVVADSEADLPQECEATALVTDATRGRLVWPATGERVDDFVPDLPSVATRTRLARTLAGYRDTAGALARLPASVALVKAVGLDPASLAAQLEQRWTTGTPGLTFRLGAGADGPAEFDLRRDGPHALVGGTTGSGKSELLQTLVASLAATYSPERVTFLLVDYKGGAAFKDCVGLPHVVGLVTDLDGGLVHRALVSLNAELRRREHVLREHGCKDLAELERRSLADAPPALVVVVDEFAALVRELPEFVDGVVDVAQRGRSLGIHLVLATQRPAGTINDAIRANTNLRIALRMNDRSDSEDVLGTPDAARLSRSQPGRAYVRTGEGEVRAVQVAYAGGVTTATGRRVEIAGEQQATRTAAEADLTRLVRAAREAAAALALPDPRRPWLPSLPDVVAFTELPETADGAAAFGLLDVPAEQRQDVATFDPGRDGGLLVVGGAGSGKTTLVRTLAVALATRHSPGELHLYALDFASGGLTTLAALPHCGAAVAGSDQERTATVFALFERELRSRADRLAAGGATSLAELERSTGETVPRLVLLLDGYPAFHAHYDKVDGGALVDRFPRLVADGRAMGLHVVVTADRRSGLPLPLVSAIERRVVLSLADRDEYLQLGIDAKTGAVPPGRGWLDGVTLQVATADVDGTAADLAQAHPRRVPVVGALPDAVARQAFPAMLGELQPTLGASELDQEPVAADLRHGHLLVTGPARSGRSTALATLARNLAGSGLRLYLFAPRRSPLRDLAGWTAVARDEDQAADLASELEAGLGDASAYVVFVDDATDLRDTYADGRLEALARRGRDLGVRVVAAADNTAVHRTYGGVLTEVRRDRNAVLLRPDVDLDGELAGVRLPRRTLRWPAGRAYVANEGVVGLVQVARDE